METAFKAFAKFGNAKSDGAAITLSNCDKWMKQAGVIDGKSITTTDTGICFNKFKAKTLGFKEFIAYVDALAKEKKLDAEDLKSKLVSCAEPGVAAGTTPAESSAVVARMTDVSKYTGAHRERFDASGHGRGIEGREDKQDTSGYVGAYKNKNTYDKTHKQ